MLDRVLEINAIFLLENHCLSFPFPFFPPFGGEGALRRAFWWSGARRDGEGGMRKGKKPSEHCGMNCSFLVTGVSLTLSKADRAHP